LNEAVRAVHYRLRAALRQGWPATLVLALIVALASGAVLTLAVGARRTAHAPDAYTAAVGGDPDGIVTQPGGRSRAVEIASMPQVKASAPVTFLFSAVDDPAHPDAADAVAFAGSRSLTARLIDGRLPHPDQPHEFVATRQFAKEHGIDVGGHVDVVTWSVAQAEQGQGFVAEPGGPRIDATLVGVIQAPDSSEDRNTFMVFPASLLDSDIAVGQTLVTVDLQPSVTAAQFRAALDALPGGSGLQLTTEPLISSDIRRAVDGQAQGTWIIAVVAALAALVALGQLLTRHVRLSEAERAPLMSMGFSDQQCTLDSLLRAAVPAVVGVVLGIAVAIGASGQFPAGFVRNVDPAPGVHVDAVALAAGALLFLVSLVAWIAVALHRPSSARTQRSGHLAEVVARSAPSPAAATGTRFALTPSPRNIASSTGTFVALGILVAGLAAATTFSSSLSRLVVQPARFGSNYAFGLGELSGRTADDLRAALGAEPDLSDLMILTGAKVRTGDASLGVVGVEHLRGSLAPRVLEGRLPQAPDELALGRLTAHDLHLDRGDRLTLTGPAGAHDYHIVGLAVVPTLADIDGVGAGAVATAEGLRLVQPTPDSTVAAFNLRAGVSVDVAQHIASSLGDIAGPENIPASIVNIARLRRIPGVLAVLLGALAVLTLVHTLITSIARRRRDLAVLRALGADGRWITSAIHWQATALTVGPLVVGLPVGVLLGATVFRAFVDHIGAVPDPAMPLLILALIALVLLVLANLAAVVPARRARRLPASRLLRAE
jgi:ABC-type lipoprotein release transport system permease subunit